MNTLTFNEITFSYEEKIIEYIDETEQVEVYSKIIILESKNKNLKREIK